jgi:hypothetical protein
MIADIPGISIFFDGIAGSSAPGGRAPPAKKLTNQVVVDLRVTIIVTFAGFINH